MNVKVKPERHAQMRKLRKQGWTLARIGKMYGITAQRVGQIVKGAA